MVFPVDFPIIQFYEKRLEAFFSRLLLRGHKIDSAKMTAKIDPTVWRTDFQPHLKPVNRIPGESCFFTFLCKTGFHVFP
jgi:hypothetical protein